MSAPSDPPALRLVAAPGEEADTGRRAVPGAAPGAVPGAAPGAEANGAAGAAAGAAAGGEAVGVPAGAAGGWAGGAPAYAAGGGAAAAAGDGIDAAPGCTVGGEVVFGAGGRGVAPAGRACGACLRRSWLLAALSANLELAWKGRRPLRDVLALDDEQLIAALGGTQASRLRERHARFAPDAARAAAAAAGTAAICRHDPGFPAALRTGPGAPTVLHVWATEDPLARLVAATAAPAIAIVGTRRASADGLEVARSLGRGLARAGVTVVSGLALGIDSAAHAGALDGAGRSVAVLAGAAEIGYPRSKVRLHQALGATGCVVSELPPGFTPRRWCFPARNRIIAGLATATIVVEGAERSGSLITADFAAQLGRDVAAVPGSTLGDRARGSNGLIRDGAAVVLDVQDALDLLGLDAPAASRSATASGDGLSAGLRALLDAIANGRRTVAALARTPEEADAVLVGLADLEGRGLVRRAAGSQWVLTERA